MKMVAAAKLRRAQDDIVNARAYAYRLYSILVGLSSMEGVEHPLLTSRPEKKVLLVVLAGDRGLCGSFNTNVLKRSEGFMKEMRASGKQVSVHTIGRKAFDHFKTKPGFQKNHEGLLGRAKYGPCAEVAQAVLDSFLSGEFDAIYLAYNEFKSAIQQKVFVERLVPVSKELPEGVATLLSGEGMVDSTADALFEPSRAEVLDALVPRHFRTQVFRAVLESVASEHGARMSAMDNATRNASEMIEALTLEYNKARQAAITKELSEIVGGMEAMSA